jgi:hypothetical protein
MTVTLNLPPDIEQAFLGEAAARGLSPDEFVSRVIISRASDSMSEPLAQRPLTQEQGVPVLRTGRPISLSAVEETLARIREERDIDCLGTA